MNKSINRGPTQLHLLWLTDNYFPQRGGMAQSCDRIVYNLRRAGVIVDLVHFTRRPRKTQIEIKRNGRYIPCPVENDSVQAMNLLWNQLAIDPQRAQMTQAVIFGGYFALTAGSILAAWLDLPLITLLRGNDFDAAIFSSKRRQILSETLQRSRRVCVVSQEKADKIKALYSLVDIDWIPNGIDLSTWQSLPSDREKAKKWRTENIQTGRRVLGIFGQIKRKKGVLFFIETLLRSGFASSFHLLLIGDFDDEITTRLSQIGDKIAYSLYPFKDRYELLAYYPACDFIVIPSFYDGMPNVMLEAAALSIPLITSTAGGMADVLEDNRHGLLFYPGDAHRCRFAITSAATIPDSDLLKMGEQCRALVEKELNHKIELKRYISVFEKTLKPEPG